MSLIDLHQYLPITYGTKYKVFNKVYNAQHTLAPACLLSFISSHSYPSSAKFAPDILSCSLFLEQKVPTLGLSHILFLLLKMLLSPLFNLYKVQLNVTLLERLFWPLTPELSSYLLRFFSHTELCSIHQYTLLSYNRKMEPEDWLWFTRKIIQKEMHIDKGTNILKYQRSSLYWYFVVHWEINPEK